jgi:aspartate/methionine/tyrosine aminotransferase
MTRKRDLLAAGLEAAGLEVLPSAGTYFLTADFRPTGFNGDDLAFCRHITAEAKVSAVPVSAFYASPTHPIISCAPASPKRTISWSRPAPAWQAISAGEPPFPPHHAELRQVRR